MSAATFKTPSKRRLEDREEKPEGWQTPGKVMQKFKLKRRALAQRLTAPQSNQVSNNGVADGLDDADEEDGFVGADGAALNPFKVPRVDAGALSFKAAKKEVEAGFDADAEIWRLLSSPAKKKNFLESKSDENAQTSKTGDAASVPGNLTRDDLPVDWSLKTRARCVFLSKDAPVKPGRTFSVAEEGSGVTAFVRRIDMKARSFLLDSSFDARLREATCYWQHPNLPWITLFPRIGGSMPVTDAKLKLVSGSVATDPVIQKGLRRDWEESLRSIYFMLKLKQCPYFYVCSSTFTCLFRASGIAGNQEIQAFVCPTTKGMRDALTREEIEYTMPLKPRRKSDEAPDDKVKDKLESKDDADSDEEMESMLMSQMGLSAPASQASGEAAGIESDGSFLTIDGKPESLVLIQGGDAQVFYGYFVDSRWGWANSGPLAGVPPSIYSPTAFMGASLAALKCRRNEVEENGQKFTQLDVTGPVMPNVIHSLLDLCEESRRDFELHVTSVPGTSSFNARSTSSNGVGVGLEVGETGLRFAVENLRYAGLDERILESMCQPETADNLPGLAVSRAISKIGCSRGGFKVS